MFQVAGWGDTEHGTPSDVLLSADLPYVDRSHCITPVSYTHLDVYKRQTCESRRSSCYIFKFDNGFYFIL